ncbi:LysM peptidoglycan-binding domain-containing protein [Photobacterium nomapromontoriensis]|uniref:LysM peptidoglycan-binding domain-containing protein n=1 Tax=Photobacterium nomapromontoriensis TaxID=2910237 RepID=UPI003D12C9C4
MKSTETRFGYLNGQLTSQTVSENSNKKFEISFDYHYSGQMATQITSILSEDCVDTLRYTYDAKDSFRKVQTTASSTRRGFKTGITDFTYNAAGHLTEVTSSKDDGNRKVFTDFNGQIALQLAGDKLSAELSVGGNPLAQVKDGKLNADLLSDSAATTGSQPGAYTVQTNDSLQRISQMVYGDSRYWYLIADANGLSPNDKLTAGKSLVIPNQHTQTYNGAESFKPYNESEVLGNVNPDPIVPPPPKKSCNPIAMIVMAVVAVVVTVYTAGAAAPMVAGVTGGSAATAATTFGVGMATITGGGSLGVAMGAAAIGGAMGSAASQLVGMGMGVVDEFSWDQVALGGLASAATAGMGAFGNGGMFGAVDGASNLGLRHAANGMASSAVNYTTNYLGNKALGNDVSFSWKNLAASAAGSLASLGGSSLTNGMGIVGDTLSGFAGAATSSVLRGESFGDNAGQMMTDAFGNALGNVARGKMRAAEKSAVYDQVASWEINSRTASVTGMGQSQFDPEIYDQYLQYKLNDLINADLSRTEYFEGASALYGEAVDMLFAGNMLESEHVMSLHRIGLHASVLADDAISQLSMNSTQHSYTPLGELIGYLGEDGNVYDRMEALEKGYGTSDVWESSDDVGRANIALLDTVLGVQLEMNNVRPPELADIYLGMIAGPGPMTRTASNAFRSNVLAARLKLNSNTDNVQHHNVSKRVFVGQEVNQAFGQGGAVINGKTVRSVPNDVSARFQGMGYLDPLTNIFKPAPVNKTMPVDHILPLKEILNLPKMNKRTTEQQISIIHDRIGVGNFQPLPKSLNSSKGSKTDWSFYKGNEINSDYQRNLVETQAEIRKNIQRHINEMYKQNRTGR